MVSLPTNIDATYADSGSDASVKLHQQYHDTVHGLLNTGRGLPTTIQSKTATYTAVTGEFVLADVSGGAFTVTLPASPDLGALVAVEKTDTGANLVTVAAASTGTITYRGASAGTATIANASVWIFEADGVGANTWRVVATNAGSNGTNGTNGTNGNTVLNGSGAPSSGTGVNGDFYIDTTAESMYGPKAAGAWGSGTSLIGPAGASGSPSPLFGSSNAQWQSGENALLANTSAGGHSHATNLLVMSVPFIPVSNITIDKLQVFVLTGGSAGSVLRFGIYQVSSSSNPYAVALSSAYATKLYESAAGIASTTSSAAVTDTLATPLAVSAGTPICFAIVAQTASPTWYCTQLTGMGGSPYGTNGAANGVFVATSASAVSGALPATYTPSAFVTQWGNGINFHRSA